MRIHAYYAIVLTALVATSQSATLINQTPTVFEYLLQKDCQQLIENGSVAAGSADKPAHMNFGNVEADRANTWCLTLTDTEAQEAHIIKIGELHPKCRVIIAEDPLTLSTSEACKSPDEELSK